MQIHKLGKRAPRIDHRTLHMARYRIPGAISVPPEVSWVTKVSAWPMMLNDSLGDCTCAAAGHMIEQWTTYAGSPFTPPDSAILTAYEDPSVGDYNPNDASTDNGAVMLDVLNYWRQTGIGGHKIFAFMKVNLANMDEVREAVYLFGNVYWGVQLPASAQGADSWTVPDGGVASPNGSPGSWGGHCVPIVAMSPETLTCVTWGETLKMSHGFFSDYGDEGYAVLSLDWIEKNGLSPGQFNLKQLEADLKIVTA
jgi:hypothetical protein